MLKLMAASISTAGGQPVLAPPRTVVRIRTRGWTMVGSTRSRRSAIRVKNICGVIEHAEANSSIHFDRRWSTRTRAYQYRSTYVYVLQVGVGRWSQLRRSAIRVKGIELTGWFPLRIYAPSA